MNSSKMWPELYRSFLKPESIFYAQLMARTGKISEEEDKLLVIETDRTTAPTPTLTAQYSERTKKPDIVMDAWIDQMIAKYPINTDLSEAKQIDDIKQKSATKVLQQAPTIALVNGWIAKGNEVLTGRKGRTSMWRGSTRPSELQKPSANLARFVPGRIGRGLTDHLDTVITDMLRTNTIAMQHFPALWYERRRDDHARTRRADADVWAPFYEQPFSRSGIGEAFDRLSKYDLTKWNTWYWMRLKQFADKSDQNGLLFIQEHYLQHNIIEEGAHWADYPWRTANNINNTGFAENPAYAGDKRIYMAEEFYDTTHPIRNQLHRAYMRKSLDEFKSNTNIIHHLGLEYTGPLHFVQFWLDVIREWEEENGKDVLVMLPGTKDVQDAILADAKYAPIVDAIDVIQWQYRKDGTLYSPIGGQSLAARQYARIMDVGETSFDQVYRAVSEFHGKYPQKAIVYSRGGGRFVEWAVFMGGGSLANIPKIHDKSFLDKARQMQIMHHKDVLVTNQYSLGKKGLGYIIFSESGKLKLDLNDDKNTYTIQWINPSTGEILKTKKKISGGSIISADARVNSPVVAWLTKGS